MSQRFDDLTRALARPRTRREALKLAFGSIAGVAVAATGLDQLGGRMPTAAADGIDFTVCPPGSPQDGGCPNGTYTGACCYSDGFGGVVWGNCCGPTCCDPQWPICADAMTGLCCNQDNPVGCVDPNHPTSGGSCNPAGWFCCGAGFGALACPPGYTCCGGNGGPAACCGGDSYCDPDLKQCVYNTCSANQTACGSHCCDNASQECCTDPASGNQYCAFTFEDSSNCGACGHVCPNGMHCDNSTCVCNSGTECNGTCVDLQNDDNNCNACGHACPGGSHCVSGTCVCIAPDPDSCGGTCTNMQVDPNNCGACGHVCDVTEICQNGSCVCDSQSTKCGNFCCASNQSCCNGVCCDPGGCCDERSGTCGTPCGGVCCTGVCEVKGKGKNAKYQCKKH